MDPLSIAASVTAIAALCGQVVVLCNNIAGRYQSIRRTLISLRTEVVAYQSALHHIQDLLLDQSGPLATYLGGNNEWTESFDTALSACSVTISILISELQKAFEASSGKSLRFLLKEEDIKDLIGELRGQQGGVQLLVQSLQLRSTADILQLLKTKHDVLMNVRKRADTLSEHWGIRNLASSYREGDSFSILSLDLEDKRFEFDEEITKFGPYKRAIRAQLQVQRRQPTPNLIDDDLLDLSIDPLVPGPWTEILQKEYAIEANEPLKDEDRPLQAQSRLSTDLRDSNDEVIVVSSSATGSGDLSPGAIESTDQDSILVLQGVTTDVAALCLDPSYQDGKAMPSSVHLDQFVGRELTESEDSLSEEELAEDKPPPTSDGISAAAYSWRTNSPFAERSLSQQEGDFQTTELAKSMSAKDLMSSTQYFKVHNLDLVPPHFYPAQLERMKKDAPLHYASFCGDSPAIRTMLKEKLFQAQINTGYMRQTPLTYAAISGNTDSLGLLLQSGASLMIDSTRMGAFHWAVVHGHRNACQLLLKWTRRPAKNVPPCNIEFILDNEIVISAGWTLLSLAAYFGHLEIAKDLLGNPISYPDFNSSKASLIPPLHAAVASVPYLLIHNYLKGSSKWFPQKRLLSVPGLDNLRTQHEDLWLSRDDSCADDKIKMIDLLSASNPPKSTQKNEDAARFTTVQAASCGMSASVLKRLLKLGYKPIRTASSSFLDENYHPMALAAFWNRTDILELLLKQFPDDVDPRSLQRTPLDFAAAMGNMEATKMLISAHARVDGLQSREQTPLSLALDWQRWEVMTYLIDAGANLTSPLYGKRYPNKDPYHDLPRHETILHLAARMSWRVQAMELLLDNGISANVRNIKGETPLHTVAQNRGRRTEAMRCLLRHGADPNATDCDGNTPLHVVVKTGSLNGTVKAIVEILIDARADSHLKNRSGKTPLDLAILSMAAEKTKRKRTEQLQQYGLLAAGL